MDPVLRAAVFQVLEKYGGPPGSSLGLNWVVKHAAKAAGQLGAVGGKFARQDAMRSFLTSSRQGLNFPTAADCYCWLEHACLRRLVHCEHGALRSDGWLGPHMWKPFETNIQGTPCGRGLPGLVVAGDVIRRSPASGPNADKPREQASKQSQQRGRQAAAEQGLRPVPGPSASPTGGADLTGVAVTEAGRHGRAGTGLKRKRSALKGAAVETSEGTKPGLDAGRAPATAALRGAEVVDGAAGGGTGAAAAPQHGNGAASAPAATVPAVQESSVPSAAAALPDSTVRRKKRQKRKDGEAAHDDPLSRRQPAADLKAVGGDRATAAAAIDADLRKADTVVDAMAAEHGAEEEVRAVVKPRAADAASRKKRRKRRDGQLALDERGAPNMTAASQPVHSLPTDGLAGHSEPGNGATGGPSADRTQELNCREPAPLAAHASSEAEGSDISTRTDAGLADEPAGSAPKRGPAVARMIPQQQAVGKQMTAAVAAQLSSQPVDDQQPIPAAAPAKPGQQRKTTSLRPVSGEGAAAAVAIHLDGPAWRAHADRADIRSGRYSEAEKQTVRNAAATCVRGTRVV